MCFFFFFLLLICISNLFRLYFLSTLCFVKVLFSMFEFIMFVFTVLCRHKFGEK